MFWRRVSNAGVGLAVLALSAIPLTTTHAEIVALSYSTNVTTNNVLSISNPGAVVGELLVAQITFQKGDQATFTSIPSGWTEVGRVNSGSEVGQAIFFKTATSSESGNYTWTFNVGAAKSAGSIMRFSGVDTLIARTINSGNSNTLTANGATVSDNSMIIALYGTKNNVSVTGPGEMTAIYNERSTDVTIGAFRQVTPAGPTGDKAATAGVSSPWVANLIELKAPAAQTFTLNYAAGAGGSLTGDTSQQVTAGGSGTAVNAVPSTGYHFVNWSDSSTENPRTDTNVNANISVTANFAINTYTLTYNAGLNGTILGITPQTVNYGASGSAVTAQANTGYHFTNWSDSSADNPRTDTNVTSNINVTANFAQDTVNYTLTYAANANGTINGMTPQIVAQGSDGTPVTAVANTGYHFVKWSDDLIANPRTDTNVVANISVTASFAINTYTLTYNAGLNGTISGTTPQTVNYGASGSAVSAVANSGYHFVNWSDSLTANPRTDTNIVVNITVTANFAQDASNYTLTYAAGANGSITGTTSQTVAQGGNGTTVTAVPNTGYHFVNWSDSSIANPRTDTNVNSNISVTAIFTANTYSVVYAAGANGTVTGSTSQSVTYGGSGTAVTAVANTGYHFTAWSDAKIVNPRTDTNVTANINVTANFAINAYTLTINVSGSGSVAKNPQQTTYNHGTAVQLTPSPVSGWRFDRWSGNLAGTSNPATVTMDANKTITATFVTSSDAIAPSTITDLTAGSATATSITLTWTAQGDDANSGTAATYDVRYATTAITEANFGSALQYTASAPKAAGSSETLVVSGLNASTTYYFAIKTADEAANRSVISNVVSGATTAPISGGGGGGGGGLGGGGGTAPAGPGVTNLSIFTDADGKFNLEATASSENNTVQLTIAQGVVAKTKDGAGLKSISIAASVDASDPPSGAVLVIPAYDFGPDGATFNPPIDLTFSFSPNNLPQGVSATNLVIVTWDAVTKQWTEVGGTIDAAKGTVTVAVSHFSTYAVIAQMRPPSWKVETLSLSATEIRPGEQLTVNTKVTNQGDLAGTTQITLRVNGETTQTRDITLGGGLGQEVTFTFTPQNTGTYSIEVNGNTATFTAAVPVSTSRPAKLNMSSLNLSSAEAKIGDEVLVTVTAANAGDVEGTFNINLKINGNIVDARQITLKGGQSEQLAFTTTQNTQGTYTIDVEGTKGEFIIIPGLTDHPKIINWWTIGAIVCASFSVLTVILLTMRRNGLLPGATNSPRNPEINR